MNDVGAEVSQAPRRTVLAQPWDIAIIGAGIVGLAAARDILRRQTGTRLVVLEKEPEIGRHQTGHNSGVIHSGIYYAPGSLKAQLCVAGAASITRFCDERGIPWQRCGKVIVATEQAELPRLQSLYERGLANGVPGLRLINADELREVEPHVRGVQALVSPDTGVVDYLQVARLYADDIQEMGGEIRTSHAVVGIDRRGGRSLVTTTGGEIEADAVVSCAGLYSDRVAQLTGASPDPRIVPFRGDYYVLRPERRHLVRGNIYPVPDPAFPFLGVHFTPRMNGDLWLGPNAVLAFSREGYAFRDVSPRELVGLATSGSFRTFARRHWRIGLSEMARALSKRRFLESLRKFIPELEMDDLLPGPSGVRAQALGADGKLVDDFVVDHTEGTLHVRNAPSPAATSSLQIGKLIADEVERLR
ncbi:MAG TPA: L-2-hydroxyglutarate oxidase [Thermomicrobiales bacterium]|nr:L-2-hydroxyglutarate oxidase [Thermomicrobiales bacterium]